MKEPRAPLHLSAEMQSFWKRITQEFELTPDAMLILRTACENWDRAQGAREQIAREGLVTADGKRHAAADVEKQAYELFLRAMHSLGLDVMPPGPSKRARGR